MFEFNPFLNTFALDLSDTVVRIIQLKKKGKQIIINSLNESLIPQGVMFDGEIKESERLKNIIKNLIKNAKGKKIKTRFVNAVLPERKTFIKLIQIPKARKTEINEAIKWEAAQHIPMSIEEIYLDWKIINQNNQSNDKYNILIGASPKTIVDSYTQLLESIDLTPISFEMESVVTIRSIFSQSKSNNIPSLVIDLGGSRTNLIIFDNNTIQFSSSLPFSGFQLTEIIAKKLKMSLQDAEKAKIIYGFEAKRGKGIIKKTLETEFDFLIEKIKEIENFYQHHFPSGKKFQKIILAGGGAKLKLFDDYLSKRLKLRVEIANPLINIEILKPYDFLRKEKVPSFTTVIGLALKNYVKT